MAPLLLLILLLVALIALLAIDRAYRCRRSRAISALGAKVQMNYSPLDRFALTQRLISAPEWQLMASDLTVKDVLYTTRNDLRCFVATVKCRRSLDQNASRFVVRVLERAGVEANVDLSWRPSLRPATDAEQYAALLDEWHATPDAART